jgi:carbon starvation protein CstA
MNEVTDSSPTPVDWGATIRLALVVSVLASLAALTLANRVADHTVICLVIAVASLLGWHQAMREPSPQPIPVRVHRR